MIELIVENNRVELSSYDNSATLGELQRAVEKTRVSTGLVTRFCAGCGRCCYFEKLPLFGFDLIGMKIRRGTDDLAPWLELPEAPSADDRRSGINDLVRQHDFDQLTATLLYEFNVAEPIIYRKTNGACVFLKNGFCTNYEGKAYTCGLYVCNMGERLASLQERIVRQGIWHSYAVAELIEEKEIEHNPFIRHAEFDTVPIHCFDVDLSEALESLFFYF